MSEGPPVLVTGSHRSGSTWVGEMLAGAPELAYIHEPFSVLHRPGLCDASFHYWFPYICQENEAGYLQPVRDMLAFRYKTQAEVASLRRPRDVGRMVRDLGRFSRARRRGDRPLVKDPIAVFSAEWLWKTFDVQPIVLIRHPAAFVSSLKRLGWTHPFDHFLAQPLLMRDVLPSFEDEIRTFADRDGCVLDQAIVLWRLIHHTIGRYRERHPDWLFVRHEDVARDPVQQFERLFAALGLTFTDRARRRIAEHSDPGNPSEATDAGVTKRDSRSSIHTWKRRLTEGEVERVRIGVGAMADDFYDEADW
jgi:Sulfotransferase family